MVLCITVENQWSQTTWTDLPETVRQSHFFFFQIILLCVSHSHHDDGDNEIKKKESNKL